MADDRRPFTAEELADCAGREVKLRARVYPDQVAKGRMTRSFAREQIEMMRQIEKDYRAKAEGERLL